MRPKPGLWQVLRNAPLWARLEPALPEALEQHEGDDGGGNESEARMPVQGSELADDARGEEGRERDRGPPPAGAAKAEETGRREGGRRDAGSRAERPAGARGCGEVIAGVRSSAFRRRYAEDRMKAELRTTDFKPRET